MAIHAKLLLPLALAVIAVACYTCSGQTTTQTQQLRPIPSTEFWEKFHNSIIEPESEEADPVKGLALLKSGIQMVDANRADVFASKAYYELGTKFYKQAMYSEALDQFIAALSVAETHPGHHVAVWHMIAETHKASGNSAEAIKASDKVLNLSGPEALVRVFREAALIRKADFLSASATASPKERQEADTLFSAVNENTNSPLPKAIMGDAARARVKNLLLLGDMEKATLVGEKYITSHPRDEFAGLIACDLASLTNHLPSRQTLERWVDFFATTDGGITNAGTANLGYELMNAYARDQQYKEAFDLGRRLLAFSKSKSDPISWDSSHKASILGVMVVCADQLGEQLEVKRLKETLLADYPETANGVMTALAEKKVTGGKSTTRVLIGSVALALVVISGFRLLAKAKQN